MSNIQTGAERMPHDLSHLGFLAGQIGRLITISTTPVIAGDSFEMDAVGALRLSPLRRGLAIDSTVRSEERFSRNAETDLVCRLLLEKKKNQPLSRPSSLYFNSQATARPPPRTRCVVQIRSGPNRSTIYVL